MPTGTTRGEKLNLRLTRDAKLTHRAAARTTKPAKEPIAPHSVLRVFLKTTCATSARAIMRINQP